MRWQHAPASVIFSEDVGLEGVGRQPAPVRVVGRRERRRLAVSLRLDRLGQERVLPVRPDDHSGSFGDRRPVLSVTADAGYPPVFDQDFLDRERLAQLRAGSNGCLDEQRVEHDPPGPVRARRAVRRPRSPRDGDRTEVERVPADRRTVGGFEPLEDAPPGERGDAGRMNEMRRHRVAGKCGLIDQQHPVAAASQQHRRG